MPRGHVAVPERATVGPTRGREGRVRVAAAWGGDEGRAEEDEQLRRVPRHERAEAAPRERGEAA